MTSYQKYYIQSTKLVSEFHATVGFKFTNFCGQHFNFKTYCAEYKRVRKSNSKMSSHKKTKLTMYYYTNEIWISEKNFCLENRHYYLVTCYY